MWNCSTCKSDFECEKVFSFSIYCSSGQRELQSKKRKFKTNAKHLTQIQQLFPKFWSLLESQTTPSLLLFHKFKKMGVLLHRLHRFCISVYGKCRYCKSV